MKFNAFLFLFLIICSSFSFAVSQSDIDTISKINYRSNILIDDKTDYSISSIEKEIIVKDNIIYTPKSSLNEDVKSLDVVELKTKGIVYSDFAKLEINNSNIDLENVGIEKGLIAIAGDDIKGNFTITFYTNMPDTSFSIKHYEGITDNKTFARLEGETIIPLIYSDEFGTITYQSNNFSTQILSFPDPLVHKAGGTYTNYYLDYFFEDYDFVSFTEDFVFLINDSISNYSQYETYEPTDDYVSYSDSMIETYFTGINKKLRLISKNYTNGFVKTVNICAYNNIGLTGEVCGVFDWRLNATILNNQFPIQKGFVPNITIVMNDTRVVYFDDYYTDYDEILIDVINISNASQNTSGFGEMLLSNLTGYDVINSSNIFYLELAGIYSSQINLYIRSLKEEYTVDVWYTAIKKNSSGSYNQLNSSHFYLTIAGNASTNTVGNIGKDLLLYYPMDSFSNATTPEIVFNVSNISTTASSTFQGKINNTLNNAVTNFTASFNGLYTFCWWGNQSTNTAGDYFMDFRYNSGSGFIYTETNATAPYGFRIFPSTGKMYVNGTLNNNLYLNSSWNFYCANNVSVVTTRPSFNFYPGGYAMTGRIDELSIWNGSLNTSKMLQLYNNGSGCSYNSCINYIVYSSPTQLRSLPLINRAYLDEQKYIDYNDYFYNYDRIFINFTNYNGTNISLYTLKDGTYNSSYTDLYYTLNFSGNTYNQRLFFTIGVNETLTLFNISVCNHNNCISYNQYLNISTIIFTEPPVQINYIDNILMQKNEIHTENWGAYFANYSTISITFIDSITNETINLLYYNESVNYITSYLNITSFLNVININTTFQSYDTIFPTSVLYIEAINAYGSVGQYVNLNINYTYVPPPIPFQEKCENVSVICLFPDYTTQTQEQMNMYMLFTILITLILLGIAIYKLIGELTLIYVLISTILVIIELIYFVKIFYLPITYVVWITLALLGFGYLLFKWVSK